VRYLNAGNAVTSVQTTCHAGTHRSVAAAEIMARMLIGRGVQAVHVTHVHRGRKDGDAY
jgi:RNase adaptor protein for sRNA GlmZ degradation